MDQASPSVNNNDQQLIDRLCKNDPQAWRDVYDANYSKVVNYLRRRNVPYEEAKEMFHEALLILDQRKVSLVLTSQLSVFLTGVAIRKLKAYWTERKKDPEQLTDDLEMLDRWALGDDQVERTQIALLELAFSDNALLGDFKPEELLQEAMKQLSQKCISLFQMRFWEGLNDQQIAARLAIEYDMVRKQFYKCKEKLKVIYNDLAKNR